MSRTSARPSGCEFWIRDEDAMVAMVFDRVNRIDKIPDFVTCGFRESARRNPRSRRPSFPSAAVRPEALAETARSSEQPAQTTVIRRKAAARTGISILIRAPPARPSNWLHRVHKTAAFQPEGFAGN